MSINRPSLVLCLALASPALAWKAQVIGPSGEPAARAEVYVLGRPGEAVTDATGGFEWRPDPVPPFEILVILPGGIQMKPVLVTALDPQRVAVIAVEAWLHAMVTVTGAAPGIDAAPAAGTTSLGADEIAIRQPSNLAAVLENVAGVRSVSEGQAAVPAVRGLARGRTLILIDGARVSSERRAGPSATTLDPQVIESVDVARGPGAVMYGSDALGGVISVRTRRVAPDSPWLMRSTIALGSGVPERRLAADVSKGFQHGSVLVSAHVRDVDDWVSPKGPVLNSGYSDFGFLARVEHALGPGVLSVSWQGDFGRDIERPRDNSAVVRFYYPSDDAERFTLNYQVEDLGAFDRLGLLAFFGRGDQVTDQDRAATRSVTRSIERARVQANDLQVRALAERTVGRARLATGLEIVGRLGLEAIDGRVAFDSHGAIESVEETASIVDASKIASGVFASIDATLVGPFTMSGGLRGDLIASRTRGGHFGAREAANGAVSGFTALTVSGGGFAGTAQFARGFREPTLSDRYFRGPTGRGFVTGNPDLSPETSRQLDLALRYTRPRLRTGVFYYHYRIDDLIERFQQEADVFLFRNRGRARLRGFELEAQADLGHGLSLDLASHIADGRAIDDTTALDDIAPPSVSAQLQRRLGSRGFAQLRLASIGRDDDPGPSERAVPGYLLVDISGGFAATAGLELKVLVRNLLDRTYFASEDPRAVLAPGRSASLVASLQL